MKQIPKGWTPTTLGEITKIRRSKINPSEYEDMLFVGLESVEAHTGKAIDIKTTKGLKSSVVLFEKGDLLFSKLRPYLNKVYLATEAGAASAEFIVFQPSPVINQRYLQILLMTKEFIDFTSLISSGDRPRVSYEGISKFKCYIPPLEEQSRILGKIDYMLELSQKALQLLNDARSFIVRFKQELLNSSFKGILTAEWRTKNVLADANKLLMKIEKDKQIAFEDALKVYKCKKSEGITAARPKPPVIPNPITKQQKQYQWTIPRTWTWTQLGTLCFVTKLAGFEYTKFVKYSPTGNLKVLKAENAGIEGFKPTIYSRVHSEQVAHLSRSFLFGGELLISFVGNVGQVALGPEDGDYFLGPNISLSRPYSTDILSQYLELFLRSSNGKKLLLLTAKSVAQSSLSMSNIRSTPVALPPTLEQQQIVNEINQQFERIDRVTKDIISTSELVKKLNESIIARAIVGELVNQNEFETSVKGLISMLKLTEETHKSSSHNQLKRIKSIKMKRKLIDVLLEATDWLSAQEAFTLCGVESNATTEDVEPIYAELRYLDINGYISTNVIRDTKGQKLYDQIKLNKKEYDASK